MSAGEHSSQRVTFAGTSGFFSEQPQKKSADTPVRNARWHKVAADKSVRAPLDATV